MFTPLEIDRPAREFVRLLSRDADVDGIDIFCCDKTAGRGEIYDLYALGMDRELLEGYRRSRVYEVDPFTDTSIREGVSAPSNAFELGNDPAIALSDRAERYWRFMNQLEVEIVGASTRRFLPGFYLVIGLSRLRSRGRRADISYGRLEGQLGQLKDMMSSAILTRLLQVGDGYNQLRHTMVYDPTSSRAEIPALSPRESEIARLICAGKQNKEIAWLTGLSIHTIENHLKRIYRKFHIQNRAALVAKMQGAAH